MDAGTTDLSNGSFKQDRHTIHTEALADCVCVCVCVCVCASDFFAVSLIFSLFQRIAHIGPAGSFYFEFLELRSEILNTANPIDCIIFLLLFVKYLDGSLNLQISKESIFHEQRKAHTTHTNSTILCIHDALISSKFQVSTRKIRMRTTDLRPNG